MPTKKIRYQKIFVLHFFVLLVTQSSLAQACSQPFFTTNITATSNTLHIEWIDGNVDPLGWEIELGEKGFTRTFQPTTPLIPVKEYDYLGLEQATTYEYYLRTICPQDTSLWNGPFFVNTHILNPSPCQINLEIPDNICPTNKPIGIDVQNVSGDALGQNVFLESVDIMIEHGWPPDLKIELESPSGNSIVLSQHHGLGSQNYGFVSDTFCFATASFSDDACQSISQASPPFIGNFQAEENFNDLLDGTNPNGTWLLKICDRAIGDIGALKYAELKFNTQTCPLPFNIVVKDIDACEARVYWTSPDLCQATQLDYGPENFVPNQATNTFAGCNIQSFLIPDLEPNTSYDVYLRTNCPQSNSAFSCPITFTTTCAKRTLQSSFDDLDPCESNCNSPCDIQDIWTNISSDKHDWIISKKATPSPFTGPTGDLYDFGNYLYIENGGTNCGDNNMAILQSECLLFQHNSSQCDMSFYHHMFGEDVNRLDLLISIDGGIQWDTLLSLEGQQENRWIKENIDLSNYDNKIGQLRFVASSAQSTLADIAIDQIDFFGSVLSTSNPVFYMDSDNDGYGDITNPVEFCTSIPPFGYSQNNQDCNDQNATINPSAQEIPCNVIDENCNGLEDDIDSSNPMVATLIDLSNESCAGIMDGRIEIEMDGGTPPYTYTWNIAGNSSILDQLGKGVYFCDIEDNNGCKFRTDFYEINTNVNISLFVTDIKETTCDGAVDGGIEITHSGGLGPFDYEWSNNSTSKDLLDVPIGLYQVTVSDANGCQAVSELIEIKGATNINAGIQLISHVTCYGESDGKIMTAVNGGMAPYEIIWNNGLSDFEIDQLSTGFYSCTITDAKGCFKKLEDIEITSPDSIQIFVDGIEHISCPNLQNGRIETTISGGNPPYGFTWNNNRFTDDIFDLSPGMYSLIVTDSNACKDSIDNLEVLDANPIQINIDSIQHVDCLYSENGFIKVDVNGGGGEYFYFWNNASANADSLNNLNSGQYQITVIDQLNCKKSLNGITINQNNIPLDVSIQLDQNNICFQDSQAVISAIVANGNPPFDFNWSVGTQNLNLVPLDTIFDLAAGEYELTVTDSEGCVGTVMPIQINAIAPYYIEVDSVRNNKCFGDAEAYISTQIVGGTAPFDILWESGEMNTELFDLINGEYRCTVIDSNGCETSTQAIEISSPEPLSVNINTSPENNNDQDGVITVNPTGGTPDYTYEWDGNSNMTNQIDGLSTGNYFLTVTDSNQCSLDTMIFVDQITSISGLNPEINFSLYPNPSEGLILITNPFGTDFEILEVLDYNGQTVNYGSTKNQLGMQLDLSKLNAGLYLIKLSVKDQIISKKIIKI